METLDPKTERNINAFRDGFGPAAVSKDLPFPDHANLTAYELLAFLPHSLQSADVVYRFISNGGTRHALWVIINTARDIPREWLANRCGTTMDKAMKDAGFEGWTVTKHDHWHGARKASWDKTILNVTGFRTPSDFRGSDDSVGNVPFKSLVMGVRRMPQGDDALDLTRMVQHCVKNPEEKWMYPQDYGKLLTLLGGPAPVRLGHLDRHVFERWEVMTPPPPRDWPDEELETAQKLVEKQQKKRRADSVRFGTSVPEKRSRETTPAAEGQRKTRGRPRKRVRLEEIDVDEEKLNIDDEVPHIEQYKRAPAEYVAAPGDAIAPTMSAINLAFAAEHDVGEADPFNTYAFGGPRHQPPYRMLHEVQQPDPVDISGWAENLRWALEQRACFWHAVQTEGWNESPVHMKLIAKTRQKQVWASDELLEQLPNEQDEG